MNAKTIKKATIGVFLILCSVFSISLQAQEVKDRNWTLSGYLKQLQTGIFFNPGVPASYLQDNLLHNRLNFKYYPNNNWTFRAELRTRVFYGDLVKLNPTYAQLVDNANNDHFDLSLVLLDKPAWVAHTMLDRLYLEYTTGEWEFRLGRQRINWGINTVWNPNDIFNAFTFTDFDYEERPGSDALSIKKYIGFASSIELVAKMADRWEESVIGTKWQFNRWEYDFQILAAYVQNQIALGSGWAGQIKNVGFKGEMTYFRSLEETKKKSFALSTGLDYVFESGLYLSGAYLYNSNGSNSSNIDGLFNFELSADNLYPYRHALFLTASQPISPLINGSLSVIYSPVEVHPLFFNPGFTLSIANNWDLDLIGQLVFNENNEKYTSPIQAIFLRIKLSY